MAFTSGGGGDGSSGTLPFVEGFLFFVFVVVVIVCLVLFAYRFTSL